VTPPRLLATICTARDADEVRVPLTAAAAQAKATDGAGALLVTSGLGAEAREAHERVAAETGAGVVHAGPGLSVARNRAIAEAGETDIVAFIDDDAIPQPDWLERLAARWGEAADDVACIGGAILPRWLAPPPDWISTRIWTSYSLLDLGPGVVELTPSAGEDAWGANVSFRAGPLRRGGGVDPALGPWPGVPMFGDESDAEQRLEAAGKRILYAGDVRVEHLIDPERLTLRELARRERWRGVSLVVSGRRSRASGIPRAIKAAAGLAVATATRNRPLVGERRARLARESGVVGAPVLTRRLRKSGWPG
jgi:GT2 family glycosyltransferase